MQYLLIWMDQAVEGCLEAYTTRIVGMEAELVLRRYEKRHS